MLKKILLSLAISPPTISLTWQGGVISQPLLSFWEKDTQTQVHLGLNEIMPIHWDILCKCQVALLFYWLVTTNSLSQIMVIFHSFCGI